MKPALTTLLLAFCAMLPGRLLQGDIVSADTGEFTLDTRSARILSLQHPRPFPSTKLKKSSRPQVLILSNLHASSVTGLSVQVTGKAARDFVVTQPTAGILAAGAATSFRVTFRPRVKGVRRASVTVLADNALPLSAALQGRGQ
jgi:hypothetical protein